jgi:hypothetical protein
VGLWLANSVFLILLLIFSGESWGQSKSPHAPVLQAEPTQPFEKEEKFLKGPIEQPSPDTRELPAFEKRKESLLGSETDNIQKQKSKIKKKVKATIVKSDALHGAWLGQDLLDLKFKSEWLPYDAHSGNVLDSTQQLTGQGNLTESITDSLTNSMVDGEMDSLTKSKVDDEMDVFAKSKVDDEEIDEYEDEEMNDKVKVLLKKYKTIEEIPMSILNEDNEIKDSLEKYLENIKHQGKFFEEN